MLMVPRKSQARNIIALGIHTSTTYVISPSWLQLLKGHKAYNKNTRVGACPTTIYKLLITYIQIYIYCIFNKRHTQQANISFQPLPFMENGVWT